MNGTKHKGTCAWCFGGFVAEGDYPVRHGWKEVGNRRVGHYGGAWHSGRCPGARYPTYQVSPRGTVARQKATKEAPAGCEKHLAHLGTRPTLYHESKHPIGRQGYSTIYAEYGFHINNGERVTIQVDKHSYNNQTFEYEKIWKRKISQAEADKKSLEYDVEFCQAAIDAWVTKPMPVHDPQKRTVHWPPTEQQRRYRRPENTYCGSRGYDPDTTENEAEITCGRCKKLLAGEKAAREMADAEKANGIKVTEWLKENGPAKAKDIKAAMGWDQKQLNRAMDRASDNVRNDCGRPAKWRYWEGPR